MAKTKEVIKIESPELNLLPKEKSQIIRDTFAPMVTMLEGFEERYKDVINRSDKEITDEVVADAKRLRLDVGQVRIKTEKLRKEQKEEYLRAGRAIDGVSNIVKWAVTDKENKLKEIESHFETLEKERLQKLQTDRVKQIIKFVPDAESRDLSSMADDVWEIFLKGAENTYNERIEAEKKAEAKRKADAKAERERRIAAEKEAEQLRKKAKVREAAAEKERKKMEEKLEAERRDKQRIADELAAREKAEADAKAKAEAELQAHLSKKDAEKIADLVADLEDLKDKYEFKSKQNKTLYSDVGLLIDKTVTFIKEKKG